jgi:hypothetical protein
VNQQGYILTFFLTKINATWNGLPYILSDVMVSSKLCDKKIVGWLFFVKNIEKHKVVTLVK